MQQFNATITLTNTGKKYLYDWIFRGINLDLRTNRFYGLFGPNGAGKSTLLKMILQMQHITEGKISYQMNGGIASLSQMKRDISYLGHDLGFYLQESALENLRFFAGLYGFSGKESEERIRLLLEKTGLWRRRNDVLKTFSRGMKQRLAVARLFIPDTKFLLLDEPMESLDREGLAMVNGILREFRAAGGGAVIISHHPQDIDALLDTRMELRGGEIKEFPASAN